MPKLPPSSINRRPGPARVTTDTILESLEAQEADAKPRDVARVEVWLQDKRTNRFDGTSDLRLNPTVSSTLPSVRQIDAGNNLIEAMSNAGMFHPVAVVSSDGEMVLFSGRDIWRELNCLLRSISGDKDASQELRNIRNIARQSGQPEREWDIFHELDHDLSSAAVSLVERLGENASKAFVVANGNGVLAFYYANNSGQVSAWLQAQAEEIQQKHDFQRGKKGNSKAQTWVLITAISAKLKNLKKVIIWRGMKMPVGTFIDVLRLEEHSDSEILGILQQVEEDFFLTSGSPISKEYKSNATESPRDFEQEHNESAPDTNDSGRKLKGMSSREPTEPNRPKRDRRGYIQPNRAELVAFNIFGESALRDNLKAVARQQGIPMPELASRILSGAVEYYKQHPEELQKLTASTGLTENLQRAVSAGIEHNARMQKQILQKAVAALKAIADPALG